MYNKISQGIQECRVVLACITPQYTHTDNCKQEVNIALGLNRPVIPLLVKTGWPIRDEIGDKLNHLECLKMNLTTDSKVDIEADVIKTLVNRLRKYVPDLSIEIDEKGVTENSHQTMKQVGIGKDVTQKGDQNLQWKIGNKQVSSINDEILEQKCADRTVSGINDEKGKQKQTNQNGISMNEIKPIEDESVDLFPADFESGRPRDKLKVEVRERSLSMSALKRGKNLSNVQSVTFGGDTRIQTEAHRPKSQFDVPDGMVIGEFGYTMKPNRSKSCILL